MATNNSVTGAARSLLRLEGALVLVVSLLLYARAGVGWGRLAALFLVPDLAMLGYLLGPRAGAAAYNAAHTYAVPLLLGGAALAGLAPAALAPVALIWTAHIGFDRALGYGLKSSAGFGLTHLGRIGRAAR